MRWNSEQEARREILQAVSDYYHAYKETGRVFRPGDRISYAARVFDEKEMCSLVDSALDLWLTTGRYADTFEKEFAAWIGVKYASLVNSGSSANLIAFSVLTAPELGERRIRRGDEVITVAAGFPTTVAPIIQYGAIPVFVDVTIPQYNIDAAQLETALSEKTKAVMLAHTLGNPFDLAAVKAFCEKHHLWLVEDNCDALGSRYTMDGTTHYTGTIGDIGTSSFYPPHHMTMGEGGCVYTNGQSDFGSGGAMKILITGGTGYLGSHLVHRMHKSGNKIACVVEDQENLGRSEPLKEEIKVIPVESLAPEGPAILFTLDEERGFTWDGFSGLTTGELLSNNRGGETKIQQAEQLLKALLESGDSPSKVPPQKRVCTLEKS